MKRLLLAFLPIIALASIAVFSLAPTVAPPVVALATVLTNAGKAIVTNRMIGSGTDPIFVAMGTGAGTAAITDTTLFTEVETRGTGTSSRVTTTVTNDTHQVVGTVTATAGRAILNAGNFDASTVGNLFVKGDFSVINLNNGDAIQFTIKCAFT